MKDFIYRLRVALRAFKNPAAMCDGEFYFDHVQALGERGDIAVLEVAGVCKDHSFVGCVRILPWQTQRKIRELL